MKRFLALGLTIMFALPVVATAVVFAEETNQNSTTTTNTKTAAETAAATKALTDRIAKRKTELKTKLTNAEKVRLLSKCKAAQGLVRTTEGRVKGLEISRGQVYENTITHLTGLSEKLKNKGIDTTELNSDITILRSKITVFNTDLAVFKQNVSDLAAMDCTTDPDGFKASLEAARTAQQKVRQDALAVRSYINDTIKPLLKTIRAQLETKKTDGEQ